METAVRFFDHAQKKLQQVLEHEMPNIQAAADFVTESCKQGGKFYAACKAEWRCPPRDSRRHRSELSIHHPIFIIISHPDHNAKHFRRHLWPITRFFRTGNANISPATGAWRSRISIASSAIARCIASATAAAAALPIYQTASRIAPPAPSPTAGKITIKSWKK